LNGLSPTKDITSFLPSNYEAIVLSDEASIEEALDLVFRAKRKHVQQGEKRKLVQNIQTTCAGNDVGALRAMEEEGWKSLDIPLICKVYLRHCITQAQNLTKQQIYECHFNNGLEFDWQGNADKITNLLSLGFSRNEALEAIMVTGNKSLELVRFK